MNSLIIQSFVKATVSILLVLIYTVKWYSNTFCIIWLIYSLKWCTIILFTNYIYLNFQFSLHITNVTEYGLFHFLFSCNNSYFYGGFYYLKIESLDLWHGLKTKIYTHAFEK